MTAPRTPSPASSVHITTADVVRELRPAARPRPAPSREEVAAVMPKVIARKIREMVPEGFELAQMAFSVELSFNVAGFGSPKTNVNVTFARKGQDGAPGR